MGSNFNRYWQFVWEEAQRRGLTKTEFMARCGFPKQSFAKYAKGQGITAKTLVNIMEGLNLTIHQLEEKSHIKLKESEIVELTNAKWLKHYAKGIEYLKMHPEIMDKIQEQAVKGS